MNPDMTTKLTRIKSALRESIEIANKATEGPWKVCEHSWQDSSIWSKVEDKTVCHLSVEDNEETVDAESVIRDANATFLAHARTMTPLACKALLTAIEGLEWVFDYTDWCADGAPDANTHDKVCNEIASKAKAALLSITSEWPDV